MVSRVLARVARGADNLLARGYLRCFGEKQALLVLLFHGVARSAEELRQNILDPRYCLTVEQIRRCIEYYLEHGYQIISVAEVLNGLKGDRPSVLLTFDDGYLNNLLILPVLEAYRVPALFAIATDHVEQGKAFWWDVLFRQRSREGTAPDKIWRETDCLIALGTEEIERRLLEEFGPRALEPAGNLDRPFTPDELKRFAGHPLVSLSNHTAGHEFLCRCSADEIRAQIVNAGIALERMAGVRPESLAYPFGGYDHRVLRIARESGVKLAFTTSPGKQATPLHASEDACLLIPRFSLSRTLDIETQCESSRFDWKFSHRVRSWWARHFGPAKITLKPTS